MTERQYLLQHLLHLSASLNEITDPKQRENIKEAIGFYAAELRRVEKEYKKQQYKQ